MNNWLSSIRKSAFILFLAGSLLLAQIQGAWALFDEFKGLTIEREKQIGEQFLLEIQQQIPLIEDPFLTSYINRLGQKLVAQLGSQPFKYKFFIVKDPSMNAFAVPGGYIFLHSGMIMMAEREGELAGVMAHEISHVYCRHMAKMMEKSRVVTIASLLGAMASIFLGGALAQPLLIGVMGGSEAAMLGYSRDAEGEADTMGFKWMLKTGYNPRDMVSMFNKMNKQRWFEGGKVPLYLRTHPFTDDRIVELSHQLAIHQSELPPGRDNPDFQYFAVKLAAICGNPNQLLRRMTQNSIREPQNPVYQYGKGLALANLEKSDEAIAAFQQALKLAPGHPLIQRDLAIFYFSQNRYQDSLQLLEQLGQRFPQDDVVLYYLGRIYQERKQLDRALPLFEKVHKLNPAYSEVYYNLGTVYGEKGQLGLAHYYLGFHSLKARALPLALFHFQRALKNLSPGDPRYLEVQRQVARLGKMKVKARD
ncbi:MAG: M48 family metalloprotease [Deltaproteobacteria bacterium]|nr:M48 family metalloprotease [Deltaproteobacteria bacterium]